MGNEDKTNQKRGQEPAASGWIRTVQAKMEGPSLEDNRADVDRFLNQIRQSLDSEEVAIDFPLVKKMPGILRKEGYDVQAVLYRANHLWHLIDILPAQKGARIFGLAVDLGTSMITIRLLDLLTGGIKGERSFLNPQLEMGPDILTRIHKASEEDGLCNLQGLLIQGLNREIGQIVKDQGVSFDRVAGMSVAGNTTMTHLFLGLDPYWLCREPYIPVINRPEPIRAGELGLGIHPNAPVLVCPNVGSYFGGDLMAGILSSGMHHRQGTSLLVDVGTNAEVVLGNRDWLMACAGAAGPALEGGVASMGMMAAPGAIDKVATDRESGELKLGTINNSPPVGICGSGLIDLVAQLYRLGMIDLRGKFVPARCGDHLREIEGMQHFVVVPSGASATGKDLTLSQADIDSLLRSKAAMFAILTTITEMVNVSLRDIQRFYIGGAFGSYIDPRSAITIGMLPDLPLETYRALGNTSLEGAGQALVSKRARDEMYRIQDQVTYIELNVNSRFMELFSAAKFIPHTDRSLFPSVKQNPGSLNIL
ncbi:MAG: DUF4445 domain-containing protein [Deltaproteobacteria bacterium]|nr:DUF4445 domain-containing protein [Deltaproteobacteria bacterium]